jgi:PAS domain S-box-containing protein
VSKKEISNKEKILLLRRSRLENSSGTGTLFEEKVTGQQLRALGSELQVFQLQPEMQNEGLSASSQLLETERSRFAGFFNQAPVGYFILDHMGMVEEANQTGADLLHTSKNAILKERFQSFVAPEMWELFYTFLHKMQTMADKQNCEIKLSLKKEGEVYTRMEGIGIVNTFTEKLQYYITVIDISEGRTAQQKLIDTSQRLEMILSASGTGTWTMELGSNKVFLDDFSFSLLEINPWEFDGSTRAFIELIHPDDQQQVRQTLMNAIHNSKEADVEFRIITKDGQIKTISVKGQEVHGVTNNYFAGIVMDITERKRLTFEAQRLHAEQQKLILSATFKAQEKERYKISSALHDSVCQILYGIRLNLQNIQLTRNLRNEFKNINQLLDQAIRETRELSYELTPSVLRDFGFTAGVKEMAQRLSTPGFQIKTSLKTSADMLHQDIQLYVFRMIQELVNNCIKHANATEAEIGICTENGWITLVVADNGQGFSDDVDQSLANGSGIRGIKNRIFLLNGYMDVETSGSGTRITIKFKNDLELLGIGAYN